MKRILIVDDNEGMRMMLQEFLTKLRYETDEAEDVEDALAKLSRSSYDLVITDIMMPGGLNGINLLEEMKKENPDQMAIMITGHGTVETAVEAMKLGAFDYILKPFKLDEMEVKITRALAQGQLLTYNKLLRESSRNSFGRIIGKSEGMQTVFNMINKVSVSDCPVLILGESGTGKELAAREIHENSARSTRPFVAVNCAALVEGLLESELFGHEKGSFTGAANLKKGKFEIADGGTLFLDEIGELPLNTQVKLLRFLQEREFERVGGTKTIRVDIRLICATNRDITNEINLGRFRYDLYYRINVISLDLPALRERPEDIPELAIYFLEKYSKQLHKPVKVTEEFIEALCHYKWKGNVRELENIIQRSVVLSEAGFITLKNLPPEISGAIPVVHTSDQVSANLNLTEQMELMEKESIRKILEENNWNQSRTSVILGVKRSSLQYKMKKYGLL